MADVKNILEAVDLGLSVGKLVSALADGVGLGDLPEALEAARKVKPALEDAGLIVLEYLDMDDAEAKQVDDLAAKFDIPNEKIEVAVKSAIHVAVELRVLAHLFQKPVA
jgi:hypothetical protein